MNADPRLHHIPPFALESDYERNQHQENFEAEREYRQMNDDKADYDVWEENQVFGEE